MHPDQIGPYQISRKIGSGGMGDVYHGIHEETGQAAAVKVLPASMTRESGFVRRFSREIEAMRQLTNRHIVKLFLDGQTEDGGYFYSMEYVDGETLTALISRRRKLPWDEVIELSSQIATALKAAHDAGIIHRDLKPSNLMISSDGDLKLTDFGVADIFAGTRLTRTGGVVGTAEYMSPEQARGKRATKQSDLYSLGAVMYVMLAGRPPFTGREAQEIMTKHQTAQFDKPRHYAPSTPRLLEDLVCRLLEKKPDDRYPDALVVLRQLDNIKGRIEFEHRTKNQTQVLADQQTSGGMPTQSGLSGDERGPATLVRDVMREEIALSKQKTPLASFFDNTFVLIALLAGVIFLGIYLSGQTEMSDEEKLAEAKKMLVAEPGGHWVRAKNDYLVPLLKADPSPARKKEIESLLRQVEDYEFGRSLKTKVSGGTDQSELHRLIRRAFRDYQDGERQSSVKQLEAILRLIDEQSGSQYLASFVQETLEDWNQATEGDRRSEYFDQQLQAAQKLIDNDEPTAALEKLDALLLLYATDVDLGALKEHAQNLRKRLAESR